MNKVDVAKNLVSLFADYAKICDRLGDCPNIEYSEAVAQAILLLKTTEEEGEQRGEGK